MYINFHYPILKFGSCLPKDACKSDRSRHEYRRGPLDRVGVQIEEPAERSAAVRPGLNIRSTRNPLLHTSTSGSFSAVSTPIFASKQFRFFGFRDFEKEVA